VLQIVTMLSFDRTVLHLRFRTMNTSLAVVTKEIHICCESKTVLTLFLQELHRESKKGATLSMAITLSILDRFTKFFHCCKEQ